MFMVAVGGRLIIYVDVLMELQLLAESTAANLIVEVLVITSEPEYLTLVLLVLGSLPSLV